MDGVRYNIEWFIDINHYADAMNDNYDPESDFEHYGGDVPEDLDERMLWFRDHFGRKQDYVRGEATFDFPPELKEVKFVHERVKDILSYFTQKFSDYLSLKDAPLSRCGDDEWYVEVSIKPFDTYVTAASYDGKRAVEAVYNEMEISYKHKHKEERHPSNSHSPTKETVPSAYLMKHISHASRELQHTLDKVDTSPREMDDGRFDEMCKAIVKEARELLQQVQSGAYDEETLDKLNRVNSRLLECIEL